MDIKVRSYIIFEVLNRLTNRERCGVLAGHFTDDGITVVRIIETPNMHPDPENCFRIGREGFRKAVRSTRLQIVGFWHTHPAEGVPDPSPTDIRQAGRYPGKVGLVYSPLTRELVWYDYEDIIKKEVI